MVIACIGDSLTEGDYGIFGKTGIANVHEEGYPYFLERLMNCEVRNFGKCGYRSSGMLRYYDEGHVDVKGADIVLIMLGTNGGQSGEGDSEENRAYAELVQRVCADAPEAKIYLLTPPWATDDPYWSNCGYLPQVLEAQAFVRRFASEEGLPLIDIAKDPRLQKGFENWFQNNDGLHCTELGYQKIAERVWLNIR